MDKIKDKFPSLKKEFGFDDVAVWRDDDGMVIILARKGSKTDFCKVPEKWIIPPLFLRGLPNVAVSRGLPNVAGTEDILTAMKKRLES